MAAAIEEAKGRGRIRLALFDHITSGSAYVLPVEQLVATCHAASIPVLIDGAHAPGQIHLNVAHINAEYYAGTLHKWAFSPPGVAFLCVKPDRQPGLEPLMVGHELSGSFEEDFKYTGHRDYSVFLAAPAALAFAQHVCGGTAAVIARNHACVTAAARRLAAQWGAPAEVLHADSCVASMAIIVLPFPALSKSEADMKAAALGALLMLSYNVTVPLFVLQVRGECRMVVRISCHVFNDTCEYDRLGDAVARIRDDQHSSFSAVGAGSAALRLLASAVQTEG